MLGSLAFIEGHHKHYALLERNHYDAPQDLRDAQMKILENSGSLRVA